MVHHLDYIELAWYASVGLGVFRLLSQFIIKMIAIFASDRFSARAFKVLRISWAEHAISIFRDEKNRAPTMQANEISEIPAVKDPPVPDAGPGAPTPASR